MEVFRFDRGEKVISMYDSNRLRATRIAAGKGPVHMTCLAVEPGGMIGAHPATAVQLFLVISGEGWVAGPDGDQVPITRGWGALFGAGETHSCGTQTGLTALAIEGPTLSLFDPETAEPIRPD